MTSVLTVNNPYPHSERQTSLVMGVSELEQEPPTPILRLRDLWAASVLRLHDQRSLPLRMGEGAETISSCLNTPFQVFSESDLVLSLSMPPNGASCSLGCPSEVKPLRSISFSLRGRLRPRGGATCPVFSVSQSVAEVGLKTQCCGSKDPAASLRFPVVPSFSLSVRPLPHPSHSSPPSPHSVF